MQIDTVTHPPIKLKPYKTPLQSRDIIDKAVDDMLEVIVEKKMVLKGFV